MNKIELNRCAKEYIMKCFKDYHFEIKYPPYKEFFDFIALSATGSRIMKIKVRAISQIGSYIFVPKSKFDIYDEDLYMSVVYYPVSEDQPISYIIPAIEWGKSIYPFKGKDYGKPGQVSKPEWGISFSQKAKDPMEQYRFNIVIDRYK